MREACSPLAVQVNPDWNITDLLLRNVEESPNWAAYRRKDGHGNWVDISWADFHRDVMALAKGLLAAGYSPGDRIGIMSRTRYEWTLFDTAIWYAGCVTVPVYDTSSPEQIAWMCEDAGVSGILVENAECLDKVTTARENAHHLRHVWSMETNDLATLSDNGTDITDDAVETARASNNLESPATIIYTSGTTGKPKGCVLTHGNFVHLSYSGCNVLSRMFDSSNGPASSLLFITLAHVFARYVQVLCLNAKATMGHTSDLKEVQADLQSFKPTFVLSVPRVFEKVYNSAEQKAKAEGRGAIFTQAAKVAVEYSRNLDNPRPRPLLRIQHRVFDALVYRKLRAAMGGRIRYAVSGSAPLGERLGHFFRGAGITILEGYGLTESTAPVSVNSPERQFIGTVGPPLPGCGIRVADDGEVLLRGINIFREYHNNPDATAAAFAEDGWFRTGDLGQLTDDGALTITGRKKEILITAGGKNVAPTILEDRIRIHPLVSQAIAVGDRKPFIAALVTLDPDMLPTWLHAEGREPMTVAEAATDPYVHDAVQKAVDYANQAVSRAESVRKFTILPVDFTLEAGHLTPSVKLKRSAIMESFAREVDDLYPS